MSFVVGQWVECVETHGNVQISIGRYYRVREAGVHVVTVDALSSWYETTCFRPVEWQVGRTYKTTLEGVTATIAEVEGHVDLLGNDSREDKDATKWYWSGTNGVLYGLKDDNGVPHLTPYLAEPEPSPAVETVLGEQSREEANDVELLDEHQRLIETAILDEQSGPIKLFRYHRTINGVTLDLYDLAEAYGIESHRVFHAVKKLILAGRRGHKDREQDLREAIVSIESELRKMKGGAS